ncbi:TPM domain-containing protein [Hydrogenophaga sp. MI9]|uniref:TPM domain-containing protein n=1 Tax=Hydrogenophaga sp. MI9 TaxID=3453719 RepID=UPI003EEEA7A4
MNKLFTILKHRWLDSSDTRRRVPDDMAQRLARRVAASEGRHSGEIRVCVEAALPLSYLWRLGRHTPMQALARQRAMSWFGRLRVWDTAHNNGVLIYLLLAEHSIEFVADRALAARVGPAQWQGMVDRLTVQLREGRLEDGLTQALEEVSAVLVEHFPQPADEANPNELPDLVVRA